MINQKPKDQFLNPDLFDSVDFEDEDDESEEDEIELDQSELENLVTFHQEQSNQVPNVLDNSFSNQTGGSEPIDQPEDLKPPKPKRQRKTLAQQIAFFEDQGSSKRFHLVIDCNAVAPVLVKAAEIKINQLGQQKFMKLLSALLAKVVVDGTTNCNDYLETIFAKSNSALLIDIKTLLEEQIKKMVSLILNQRQFYESKLVEQALKENEDQ